MARFHLHARLIEGSLAAPERNELQTSETDEHGAALALAEDMARRGFAVWVYEHRHHDGTGCQTDPYRVIAECRADGSRVR